MSFAVGSYEPMRMNLSFWDLGRPRVVVIFAKTPMLHRSIHDLERCAIWHLLVLSFRRSWMFYSMFRSDGFYLIVNAFLGIGQEDGRSVYRKRHDSRNDIFRSGFSRSFLATALSLFLFVSLSCVCSNIRYSSIVLSIQVSYCFSSDWSSYRRENKNNSLH